MDTLTDNHLPTPYRRAVRFASIEEALADAARLVAAEQAGTLVCTGNWTLGQILNHLGAWAEFPFDGAPLTVPWYVRCGARLFKKRILSRGMPPGRRLPGIKGGTLAAEPVPTAVGLPRFQKAFARLARECPELPNPLFGKLTHGEWIALHLRHAELHLSFCK